MARKKGKSIKPETLKAAVLVRRGAGQVKAQIAKDLGIHRDTVSRILNEAEVGKIVAEAKSDCVRLVPRSVENIGEAVDAGDLKASFGVLKGTGVLKNGNGNGNGHGTGGINFAVAVLDDRRADALLAAFTAMAAPTARQA